MTNGLEGKLLPLDKHNVHGRLVDLPTCQLMIRLYDMQVTFVGVNEQITERVPCADTLRDVLLVADSSLRSVPRATFVSRVFCGGVYLLGFEGRTSRHLEVRELSRNILITKHLLPIFADHGLHIAGWNRHSSRTFRTVIGDGRSQSTSFTTSISPTWECSSVLTITLPSPKSKCKLCVLMVRAHRRVPSTLLVRFGCVTFTSLPSHLYVPIRTQTIS